MNVGKQNEGEEFINLIQQLKVAEKEVWNAKIALHDAGKKYAPLCIKILLESRHIPTLKNNRIAKRTAESGLDPVHPDFWDPDMLIALAEHYKEIEENNACT